MTTQPNGEGIVYENLSSTQPEAAYNADFASNANPPVSIPTYAPQSQPMYVPQSQPMYVSQPQPMYTSQPQPMYAPQPMYMSQPQPMQPVYVSQPQTNYPVQSQPVYISVQQPIQQKPMTREAAINAQLQFKNCCCCFSYSGGIRFLAVFEIVVWLLWAITATVAGLLWTWLFLLFAVGMCYFGYVGAAYMNEKFLRIYMYYLGTKAVIYFLLIYVSAANGMDGDLAAWTFACVIMTYWFYIARDFVNTIRDFDAAQQKTSLPQP